MADHWLDVLFAVVERYGGSVVGHPSQLVADGRAECAEWLRLGWPATGRTLVDLLVEHATDLLGAGLLVHHIPTGIGQPEWLAVTDVTSPLQQREREPLGAIPVPELRCCHGSRSSGSAPRPPSPRLVPPKGAAR